MRSLFHFIIASLCLTLVFSCSNERYRVLYINSYNEGYPPSDEIMQALAKNLPTDSFELKIEFLNSKIESSADNIHQRVDSILKLMYEFQPDIVVISDDNAMKYLVEPYASEIRVPIVFCGINWSAGQYQFSKNQITGMLEVLPLTSGLQTLKALYPQSKTLAVLSENTLSEKNNTSLLDTLYRNLGFTPEYFLVDSFAAWKQAFIQASEKFDIIYTPTNGAVKGWNEIEAKEFVYNHITKPVFTCDDFMMPYAVVGFTKVASEQGRWVAETIKRINRGEEIINIPQTRNTESKIWINSKLSEKIGFKPDNQLLGSANKY